MKIVELLMRESLPQKSFFRVFEVCSLLNVTPHEIRVWESEFPQVRSQKTADGQRIYRREVVVVLSAIKHLLYEKDLTVAGAQRVIAQSVELSSIWINDDVKASVVEPMPVLDMMPESECSPSLVACSEESVCSDELFLTEASRMLEDDDDFDEVVHQIYHHCADELVNVKADEIEPVYVGEMIQDAIIQKDLRDKQAKQLSKLEYEKTLHRLIESKKSLTDLIATLDKIHESNFWQNFYH